MFVGVPDLNRVEVTFELACSVGVAGFDELADHVELIIVEVLVLAEVAEEAGEVSKSLIARVKFYISNLPRAILVLGLSLYGYSFRGGVVAGKSADCRWNVLSFDSLGV